MFKNATIFNQGISSWCVGQISTEPTEFSLNFALQDSFKRYCGANCTMGITELLAANFKIFPNPTRDVLYTENSSQSTIYKLTVLNIPGREVLVKNVTD